MYGGGVIDDLPSWLRQFKRQGTHEWTKYDITDHGEIEKKIKELPSHFIYDKSIEGDWFNYKCSYNQTIGYADEDEGCVNAVIIIENLDLYNQQGLTVYKISYVTEEYMEPGDPNISIRVKYLTIE